MKEYLKYCQRLTKEKSFCSVNLAQSSSVEIELDEILYSLNSLWNLRTLATTELYTVHSFCSTEEKWYLPIRTDSEVLDA